jgi:nucleotide-binding universal stress UspA family protein
MVIVCGIDGSARSREAARAAASFAKLQGGALVLAYVQEAVVLGFEPIAGATPVALANTAALEADRNRMKAELEREAERLGQAFGIQVRALVRTGLPDLELARVAEEEEAELLVVASLGRRSASMWRLGSVADRLSQSSPVALLVVRDPRPFERWAKEGAKLAVALALGTGKPTRAAGEAARGLTKLGSLVLTEVHVYDPLEEARRRGLESSADSLEARAEIESSLARELPSRVGADAPGEGRRFVALPSRAHLAEALAEFVDEERFDLLLMGANRHGALGRRFFGSISYGVLPMVATNVLLVPPKLVRDTRTEPVGARPVQRVLVATDLSETGNRAVGMALGLLREGGQLVLLHVDVPVELPSGWIMGYHPGVQPTPGERRMKRSLAEAELEKLARTDTGRAFETLVEVVEASDVPRAILEAAERHEADLLCLGTHHYGRVASALIGSVARTVARRSTRPVLLVPDGG